MGWRGALRTIAADARRWEREERRRARDAERAYREAEKAHLAEAARLAVESYAALVESLSSIHREGITTLDWAALRAQPPPAEPAIDRSESRALEAEISGYQPGFFERLFGLTARRRRIEEALAAARASEEAASTSARAAWYAAMEEWKDRCELADRVLGGDIEAYGSVIQTLGGLSEIGALVGKQTIEIQCTPKRGTVSLRVEEDAVVPVEEYKLTARGQISKKKIAAGRRLEIYEDYVCGAALRVARELLAAVPFDDVIVHVGTSLLNPATGHFEDQTILSVLVPRAVADGVNWERVDASDLVGRLRHHVKRLGRGKGFAAVPRIES